MEATKKWYESSGILGPIGAVITMMLDLFGVKMVEAAEVNTMLYGMGEMVGIIMGIIGRWKATAKIV